MTILAGLSPVGALIVRAGEPKVLNVSLAQADGSTPQNLEGRTFALIVRRSSRTAPLFTILAELSADALYVIVMITAEQATQVYDAGKGSALSYDIVELSGNASISRFTQRVTVEAAPDLPSDIVPVWPLLPYTEAMVRPDAMVVTERGASGDGTPALEAAETALAVAEQLNGALDTVDKVTTAARAVVTAQAENLATIAAAVTSTGEDRAAVAATAAEVLNATDGVPASLLNIASAQASQAAQLIATQNLLINLAAFA
jgi:hypothetical protein